MAFLDFLRSKPKRKPQAKPKRKRSRPKKTRTTSARSLKTIPRAHINNQILEHPTNDRSIDRSRSFKEMHTQLEEMREGLQDIGEGGSILLTTGMKTNQILQRLTELMDQHDKFTHSMWSGHDPKIFKAVVKLSLTDTEFMERFEQDARKVLDHPDIPDEAKSVVNDLKNNLEMRNRSLDLVKTLLNHSSLNYEEIASELKIAESRARGLVSMVVSSGIKLQKTKTGNKVYISINPSIKPAIQEAIASLN